MMSTKFLVIPRKDLDCLRMDFILALTISKHNKLRYTQQNHLVPFHFGVQF